MTERGSHRCWRRVGCHSAYAGLGEHLNLSPNPIASRGTKADGQGAGRGVGGGLKSLQLSLPSHRASREL